MRKEDLLDLITESVKAELLERKGRKKKSKDKEKKAQKEEKKDEQNSSAYLTKQRKVDKILSDPTVDCAALYRKAFPEDYRNGDEDSQRGYHNKKKNKAKGPNGKSYHWTMEELTAIIKAFKKPTNI